ncbi:hypothetical protein [Laribacter hongkongensis]|uniref:hypothetical protein n=1 Tax=Laribacter hongkongensis TaxID=168471 RepID=UPI001EFC8EC4|nr:hypothetical protein [Laribacter hongkongensis]MCG9081339.1 hypothetical protein [Laribacter hongkongensis]
MFRFKISKWLKTYINNLLRNSHGVSAKLRLLEEQVANQQIYLDKTANSSLSYFTFNGQRIDRMKFDLWEAHQAQLDRVYGLAASSRRRRRIQVVFLVADTSLWDVYEPIFRRLQADTDFMPRVCAFQRVDVTSDKNANEVQEFFDRRGVSVELAGFDGQPCQPLDPNRADLVFYTLGSVAYPEVYRIENVSHYARTCYLPYGFLLANESEYQFNQDFHHSAWTVFASTAREEGLYTQFSKRRRNNVIRATYPKLELLDRRRRHVPRQQRPLIIWAPHWTIDQSYPKLNLGMFDRLAQPMLGLFAAHPEVDFVFKPHPNLLFALQSTGLMDEVAYAEYLEQLEALHNVTVWKHGGYTDLFLSSHALLTDSVSFLAEYLPTGNPLLFLDREDRIPLSDVGEQVISMHYKARDFDAVRAFVEDQVLGNQDPQREARLAQADQVLEIEGEPGSLVIHQYLRRSFHFE